MTICLLTVFDDSGVLCMLPASSLYGVGMSDLNRYPAPNRVQTQGSNYNYALGEAGGTPLPLVNQLQQQPAIRLDSQLSPKMRLTWTYGGDRQRVLTTPGGIQSNGIPGFTDTDR